MRIITSSALKFALSIWLLAANLILSAQQHTFKEHLDSLSAFKVFYYTQQRPDLLRGIDTGINNIEEYNFIQKEESEYLNLGNVGTAAYSQRFIPSPEQGFQSGLHPYDLYYTSFDSIRYYQCARPYTHLQMNLGLRQELNFSGQHAQQLGKHFNIGAHFNRIFSIGYYQRQKAVVNNVSAYLEYHTLNKRFVTRFSFLYNSARTEENGGLAEDFVNNPRTLINKQEIDVNTLSAENYYRSVHARLSQKIGFGYPYTVTKDTFTLKMYQSLYEIEFVTGIGRDKNKFLDSQPDSLLYGIYYSVSDSAWFFFQNRNIHNEVWMRFTGFKKQINAQGIPLNFICGTGLVYDNYELAQNTIGTTTNILAWKAYLRNNASKLSAFTYNAEAAVFLSGYNQGDVHTKASLGYAFKKAGNILANAEWSLKEPEFVQFRFVNGKTIYANDFTKISTLHVSAAWQKKINVKGQAFSETRICAHWYLLNNYVYFSASKTPAQESRSMNVIQAELTQNFQYKHLHLDNYILLQYSNRKELLNLPNISTKHSFYYENFLFKKALLARIGLDLRYWTNHNPYGYDPLIGQFYVQNDFETKMLPVLDVFINMRVKTVRLYVKGNNLLQGIGQPAYYTAFLYPGDERSFKFGVSWRFLD